MKYALHSHMITRHPEKFDRGTTTSVKADPEGDDDDLEEDSNAGGGGRTKRRASKKAMKNLSEKLKCDDEDEEDIDGGDGDDAEYTLDQVLYQAFFILHDLQPLSLSST